MTDSHRRLLAAVARRQERERDLRTVDLSHSATRARKQVSAARARRRLATGDEHIS